MVKYLNQGVIILFALTLFSKFSLSQLVTEVKIPGLDEGKVEMNEALINPSSNMIVFDLNHENINWKKSIYVVLDYKRKKIISTFIIKNTLFFDSWIQNDSLLYLSKVLFGKKIINLKTGKQIDFLLNSKKERPSKQYGQGILYSNNDFYCSDGLFNWNDLLIYLDEKKHIFRIYNELEKLKKE